MEDSAIVSAGINGRRSVSNSPEFEFWMLRNPSCPQTTLHSADQLFAGGIILPLNTHFPDHPPHTAGQPPNIPTTNPNSSPAPEPGPESDLSTTSKRWKDIFKKIPDSKEKVKKKERKGGSGAGGGGGTSMAELNINLWPFSRSRSAGNGGSRRRIAAAASRKGSSAPCSRSNSAGPVSRVGSARSLLDNLVWGSAEKDTHNDEHTDTRRRKKFVAGAGAGTTTKVLNFNVPTFTVYRNQLSCKSNEIQENITGSVAGVNAGVASRNAGGGSGGGDGGSNQFNLRSFFSKKVY